LFCCAQESIVFMKQKIPSGVTHLNLPDIQGLLLRGYKGFDYIRHMIFRIDDIKGIQALCKALLPHSGSPVVITDSTTWPVTTAKPAYRLNIALTSTGVTKIVGNANYGAVANASSTLFSLFTPGAVADAPNIGDVGTNDPKNWWPKPGWQLTTAPKLDQDFDFVLSLYARTPAGREFYCEMLSSMVSAGAAELTFQQDSDPLPAGPEVIHFGYQDGISQPRIDGAPGGTVESAPPGTPPGALLSLASAKPGDDPDDRPKVPSWNFIIEDGAAPNYNAHPFLVNGSFGAFRLLYQDVQKFEALIASQPDPEKLAAKMCGRWRDGTPLEVSPEKPDPSFKGFDLTNFQYLSPSQHQRGPKPEPDTGQVCPYAAHIRRTNPRDDTNVLGNAGEGNADAVQHRILRRARPYGHAYVPGEQADRGLVGYFIGANLTAQFHFLMQTWMIAGGFAPLTDGSPNQSGYDPLFGPSPAPPPPPVGSSSFEYCTTNDPSDPSSYTTVPTPPSAMPQLVITKGGLYVFFPSITALTLMAEGKITS
jgi:deferrochelatase/peroxidase EfeB